MVSPTLLRFTLADLLEDARSIPYLLDFFQDPLARMLLMFYLEVAQFKKTCVGNYDAMKYMSEKIVKSYLSAEEKYFGWETAAEKAKTCYTSKRLHLDMFSDLQRLVLNGLEEEYYHAFLHSSAYRALSKELRHRKAISAKEVLSGPCIIFLQAFLGEDASKVALYADVQAHFLPLFEGASKEGLLLPGSRLFSLLRTSLSSKKERLLKQASHLAHAIVTHHGLDEAELDFLQERISLDERLRLLHGVFDGYMEKTLDWGMCRLCICSCSFVNLLLGVVHLQSRVVHSSSLCSFSFNESSYWCCTSSISCCTYSIASILVPSPLMILLHGIVSLCTRLSSPFVNLVVHLLNLSI